jgi:ketosteroid isomerase-like protein
MTSNDDLDLLSRVERLEQRLRTVEDELEITRTVVEYGLAVDAGEAEVTGQLFTEDTVFDVDGNNIMRGRAAVEAMVLGPGHQSLLPNCAHTIGPIVVDVDGDSARATGYSRIYRATGDSFELFRIGCNQWELERRGPGWRINKRTTRVLGSLESQAILRSGLRPR